MRVVGVEGVEADDELHLKAIDDLQHRLRVGLPAQVGLDAFEDDEVALRRLVVVKGVLRPVDAAHLALVADGGAKLGEIEELLGVDLGQADGAPALGEVLGGGGGGAAGV